MICKSERDYFVRQVDDSGRVDGEGGSVRGAGGY
jgi:hypothetical protein